MLLLDRQRSHAVIFLEIYFYFYFLQKCMVHKLIFNIFLYNFNCSSTNIAGTNLSPFRSVSFFLLHAYYTPIACIPSTETASIFITDSKSNISHRMPVLKWNHFDCIVLQFWIDRQKTVSNIINRNLFLALMEGCSLSDRHQNCYGTYSFLLFFIFVSSLFSPMTSYIVCLVIYHYYAAIVFCLKFTIFWHFFLFECHKRPYYVGYVYILHKFCWKRTNDLIIFRN